MNQRKRINLVKLFTEFVKTRPYSKKDKKIVIHAFNHMIKLKDFSTNSISNCFFKELNDNNVELGQKNAYEPYFSKEDCLIEFIKFIESTNYLQYEKDNIIKDFYNELNGSSDYQLNENEIFREDIEIRIIIRDLYIKSKELSLTRPDSIYQQEIILLCNKIGEIFKLMY